MPVLIWKLTEHGAENVVETDWKTAFTTEEHREEAEALDQSLDVVLDETLRIVDGLARDGSVPIEFVRAWSIGTALSESDVQAAPALKNEPRDRLWLALSRKCRTGARSNGELQARWQELRPSTAREPRREGRRLDYFELCLWVSEQTFDDATETFGGSVRNAWQMLERPTLRPLIVRKALLFWLQTLDQETRGRAVEPSTFPELMKALRARWPDRGPGSAKRPIHYSQEELANELGEILDPLIKEEI